MEPVDASLFYTYMNNIALKDVNEFSLTLPEKTRPFFHRVNISFYTTIQILFAGSLLSVKL